MLAIVLLAMLVGVICSLTFIEKTEIAIIGCVLSISIPLLLWLILEGLGFVYQPTSQQNQGGNTNTAQAGDVSPLEFPDDQARRLYNLVIRTELFILPAIIMIAGIVLSFMFDNFWPTIIAVIISVVIVFIEAGKQWYENPLESFSMISFFGKPIAYARRGGPFMKPLFLAQTLTESNKNITVGFGKEAAKRDGSDTGSHDELAAGCASANQSLIFKEEFIKTFNEATYKPEGINGQQAYDRAVDKNELNHTQTMFKPEVIIVLEVDYDQNLENISNYFKNIPGDTREYRIDYIKNQLRENLRSQINTQFKKYTYSMLSVLMTTDALDNILKEQVKNLITNQELGLKIISLKLTALGATQDVHDAQEAVAKSIFTAQSARNTAHGTADSAKITATGEAESAKIKAEAEKIKRELEGEGAASAFRSMSNEELNILEDTVKRIKLQADNNPEILSLIIKLEYELEQTKQYGNIKGPVIIKDVNSASNGGTDNSVQTVLLVQAINKLNETLSNRA